MTCVESEGQNQENVKPDLPELLTSQLEHEIKLVILEYFQNGDSIEVWNSIYLIWATFFFYCCCAYVFV